MKHNFLAWRYLDANPADTGSGAIVKAIEDLGKSHTEQVQQVQAQQQKALDEAKEILKGEVKTVKDEQDKIRDMVREMKARGGTQFGAAAAQSFEAQLTEAIEKKAESLAEQKAGVVGIKTKQPFSLKLETKAVGDVQASNFTGTNFIPPTFRPGIIMNPVEAVRLRNILPIGATSSPKITYPRENGGEGDVAMVAPGGTKPQMDFDLTLEEADVRKIAGHIRVHEEVLEDIPYITSYLTRKGTEKVLDKEDAQILYGDGTGQNLEGLFTAATAFDFPEGNTVTSANRFDVLRAARLQMRRANRMPSVFLVSPLDYFLMTSAKDTTNNYTLLGGGNGLIPSVYGIPILEHTKINDGDFLALDRNSAEIAFRKGIEVRFYEQDRDNAITNMITIVVEERLALPIYEPGGIVKGTFTAALTDLGSATV